MGIIFWMPLWEFLIWLRKWLCVYSLAIKSHLGLVFYAMSVKPMQLGERARFTAGVNSRRFAAFSCPVMFCRHWGSGQGKEGSWFLKSYIWSDCILIQVVLRWFVKHVVMNSVMVFYGGKNVCTWHFQEYWVVIEQSKELIRVLLWLPGFCYLLFWAAFR